MLMTELVTEIGVSPLPCVKYTWTGPQDPEAVWTPAVSVQSFCGTLPEVVIVL